MKSLIKAFKLRINCIVLLVLKVIFVGKTVWALKEKCNSTTNKYLQKMYVALYEKRLGKFGSWIGYNAIIDSPPNFPTRNVWNIYFWRCKNRQKLRYLPICYYWF